MPGADRTLLRTNLNLLPTLRAVLKHRNLTRVAEELNVTQAAVSNNLRRLREHFGDELLVKDGRRMRLTERAKGLVEPLETALTAVKQVLEEPLFEPAQSHRHFKVATADYVTIITMPEMAHVLSRDAPHMTVQMLTARGRTINDLQAENIDLVIAPKPAVAVAIYGGTQSTDEFSVEHLMREPFVCLGRRDDKALSKGLTMAAYLARPHASFALDVEFHASLELGYLREHGIQQNQRILTSDFSALPVIASQSDCLVLVPRSMGRLAVGAFALQMVACPLPIPDLELMMIWNARRDRDPELQWLRQVFKRCVMAAGPATA